MSKAVDFMRGKQYFGRATKRSCTSTKSLRLKEVANDKFMCANCRVWRCLRHREHVPKGARLEGKDACDVCEKLLFDKSSAGPQARALYIGGHLRSGAPLGKAHARWNPRVLGN